MQAHALSVADRYQVDRLSWKAAAENLRAPYWDWASPFNIIPPAEVMSLQTVLITTFDGSTISVTNPLYQYKFHPTEETFFPPFKLWQNTLRHPNPPRSPDATTDVKDLREYDLTFLIRVTPIDEFPKPSGINSV
jgi:tyrosinase